MQELSMEKYVAMGVEKYSITKLRTHFVSYPKQSKLVPINLDMMDFMLDPIDYDKFLQVACFAGPEWRLNEVVKDAFCKLHFDLDGGDTDYYQDQNFINDLTEICSELQKRFLTDLIYAVVLRRTNNFHVIFPDICLFHGATEWKYCVQLFIEKMAKYGFDGQQATNGALRCPFQYTHWPNKTRAERAISKLI
jgi:hypothetical protein